MSAYSTKEAEATYKAYILRYINGSDDKHATAVSVALKKYVKHGLCVDQWNDFCNRLVEGSAVELEHTFAIVCESSEPEWVLAIDPIRYALSQVGENNDELNADLRDNILVNTILSIALLHICETIYYYDELPKVEHEGKVKKTKLQSDWFDILSESLHLCTERKKKQRLVDALDSKNVVVKVGALLGETQSISAALAAAKALAAPVFSALG